MANRKLIYYIFALAILISLVVQFFVFSPMINDINNTKNTAETKKEELFNLQKRERQLKTLSDDYNEYKQKIDILSGMFPKGKDISSYITQIQNAASINKVEVKGLKVLTQAQTDKKASDQYTQMVKKNELYELSMEATIISDNYSGLVSMVKTMEQVSRFTNITKLTIKNDRVSGKLETSLIFKIYVL